MSARVNPENHSRWKTASTRYAIAALLLLACAGIFAFLVLTRGDMLPQVSFMPASPPSGLKYVGSSRHGSDDEDFLTREEHFARQAAALPTSTGPGHDAMTVATTSYRVGLIDPNLEGRLSGEVYHSVNNKPQARPVTVRGRDGVLEVFRQRPEGSQLHVLTWIERPGVYIRISVVDLTEQQLLETANSLREQ
jgi:hypothetical protein